MHAALQLIQRRHRLQAAEPGAAGAPAVAAAAAPAAMFSAVPGRTALVLDSPHSGTTYPDDFRAAIDLPTLRRAEDTHVEKLYAFAPALGAAWVEAHFPRIYLDANRDTTEVDASMFEAGFDTAWTDPVTTDPVVLQKVRLGKGLIWKFTDEGVPIYDRLLSVAEARARIDRCWRPYHAAVARAIDEAHARHGYSIHINCHSMPAVAASHATLHPGLHHADFVIGDRDGTTASPALSQAICAFLRERGYSVDYNHPYKGVELVRRYGHPATHRHSIQVEINRKLYMDERTLAIEPAGFARLQSDLRALVEWLLATDPRQ
ncbi:N-formylglutamate amidohydrolase [Acidovorax sp. SUPP2522]|uniref:N-formylglutamate amidohydrolase n=1 Tax=unclassified Acidovorax TaxID=2684926 RepID=UPI00234B2C8C|nr:MULTISPECIES: N-formylglutamate amidohydrolase [unclassified Acidovorax]WCM98093.1 N-formylglutamate amidohydrolase [Acidovorax sp. GBBC 1281]GKT19249.1 N-formylglutamate amidohydrolase [Acidovorax sp. SUPP2522]